MQHKNFATVGNFMFACREGEKKTEKEIVAIKTRK